MIPALLLGVCAATPLFDATGPDCPAAAELEECRCSECFMWDPTPGALWYVVQRTDMDGTLHTGTLPEVFDEEGNGAAPPPIWCPAKHDNLLLGNRDAPDISPREGRTYRYTVSAGNPAGTSAPSPTITYVAAPYAHVFRPPIQGNIP